MIALLYLHFKKNIIPFMKSFLLITFIFISSNILLAQTTSVKRSQFFSDTSVFNATIISNNNKLFKYNEHGVIMPARFVTTLADSTHVDDPVQLEIRGHFRHSYCRVPPLKIIFKYKTTSVLSSLKSLKLVSECKLLKTYDQYLLKEFLIYKMYNLLTPISFNARLLNINFQDSANSKKIISEHAFLIEDLKEVAKRNNCKEWKQDLVATEQTNRKQMTMTALFEYMIGNTDFAVSVNHNMKLIVDENQPLSKPFAVPYDFDYAGLVNTEYAVPDEKIGTESVTQRVYRGFARTMDELNEALDVYKKQKEKIYSLINNFNLLTPSSKREMINYLDDFYAIINNPKDVKYNFIDNARKGQ